MTKHRILFLAANPTGSQPMALDREARAIQVELERSGFRDHFDLVTRWAVEPMDLLRELSKVRPTVAHGGSLQRPRPARGDLALTVRGCAPACDRGGWPGPRATGGLCFQAADGSAQLVSAAAIEQTFGAAGSSVRVVVLNACYSAAQAEALLAHVDCVVGMSGAIGDDAARHFAVGFYGGLGEREPVAAALQQGRAAISLEGLADGDLPQLRVRAGVDARQLVLADPR